MKKHSNIVEMICVPIILNKKGEVLLVKSPKWKGQISVPGGHVELGETVFETACREGLEETGLKLKPLYCVNIEELINPPGFYRKIHFISIHVVCKIKSGKVKIDEKEISDFFWIKPKDALKIKNLTSGIKETLINLINGVKFNIDTFK